VKLFERRSSVPIYVLNKTIKDGKLTDEFFEYLKLVLHYSAALYLEITTPDAVIENYLIAPKPIERFKETKTPTNCLKDIVDIKCRIVCVFH
jgi:hypothetical protein